MGLITFLSAIFLFLIIILFFCKEKMKNSYIILGIPTFILVVLFGSMYSIPSNFLSISISMLFNLLLLTFGISCGLITLLFNGSVKLSIILAFISSTALILLLFNFRGYISYMFIPVLLIAMQRKIAEYVKK